MLESLYVSTESHDLSSLDVFLPSEDNFIDSLKNFKICCDIERKKERNGHQVAKPSRYVRFLQIFGMMRGIRRLNT